MRYVEAIGGEVIPLGRQGENEVETVQFNVSGWADVYGDGTFTLSHQRCCDGDGFNREITMSDDGQYVLWLITSTDVAAAGRGRLQLTYTVNDAVAKSVIYSTHVTASLNASEDVPMPWKPWVDQVLEAGENAVESAQSASESEANVKAAEENVENYARIAEESAAIAETFVGAPLTASTVDAMTDTTRIYVYVGSETGMSNGYWYYWNGAAWVSGGVYNAVEVDVATNQDIDNALYS